MGWVRSDRELYLLRRLRGEFGDLLRVAIDPDSGRPAGDPQLVYPRIEARVVRVSADGSRFALLAGDSVRNVQQFTFDGTPDASDNPVRSWTHGTGLWTSHGVLADGSVLASLAPDGADRSLLRRDSIPGAVTASPDGARVFLALEESGGSSLLVREVVSGRSRSIALPEPLSSIDLAPDGRHLGAMTSSSADHLVVVDLETDTARTVKLDCGDRCEFAYEGIQFGPEWPYAAITSEVDTWIVNVETGALRHFADRTWNIIDWIGPRVYFARGGGQTDWPGDVLFRVPAEGGAEERLLDLPIGCNGPDLDPSGRSVFCAVDESRGDLFVIDGLGVLDAGP